MSFTRAFVKLLPPIGMLRCWILRPLVITTSVVSTPMATITIDAGGFSGSATAAGVSRSNIAMFASATGASCRMSTCTPARWSGARALKTWSRFIAKIATSASIAKPPSSMPPGIRCQSQAT